MMRGLSPAPCMHAESAQTLWLDKISCGRPGAPSSEIDRGAAGPSPAKQVVSPAHGPSIIYFGQAPCIVRLEHHVCRVGAFIGP